MTEERYIACRQPGWYGDQISMEDYHGPELTPEYAMSSSGAVEILESPLTMWAKSPLNPEWEPENRTEFDIGKAVHLLVLEDQIFEDEIKVLPYENWKTVKARDERDELRQQGVIPLLSADYQLVLGMRDAVARDPLAQNILSAANKPLFEQTFVTIDEVSRRWYRARPDVCSQEARCIADVKTTTDADADAFSRVIKDQSYHQRAAWQLDEANASFVKPQFDRFFFIAITKPKAPARPLVNVLELDPEDIQRGRERNAAAKGVFHHCMSTGIWPGIIRQGSLEPVLQSVGLPVYARQQHDIIREAGWLERLAALRSWAPPEA